MGPTRVVLDCDTANEVDDQFAITHALGAPGGTLEVRGVVSVSGREATVVSDLDERQVLAGLMRPDNLKPDAYDSASAMMRS